MTVQASGRSRPPADLLQLRPRPACGHRLLMECQLDLRDWQEVHRAYRAFLAVCRSVALKAHEREVSDG